MVHQLTVGTTENFTVSMLFDPAALGYIASDACVGSSLLLRRLWHVFKFPGLVINGIKERLSEHEINILWQVSETRFFSGLNHHNGFLWAKLCPRSLKSS